MQFEGMKEGAKVGASGIVLNLKIDLNYEEVLNGSLFMDSC